VPFDCAPAGGSANAEPAPLSDEEVARSFEAQVRASLFGAPWRALVDDVARGAADALGLGGLLDPPNPHDPDHSALLEALRKHSLHYRVVRVVSWRRTRCTGEPGRRSAFYLEATLPSRPGEPAKRLTARLTGQGRLQGFGIAPTEPTGHLPPAELATLEDGAKRLAVEAGGPVEDAEYVFATGYPSCYAIPCVAARRGDTLYLLEARGRVFAFSLEPHTREEAFPTTGRPCLGGPCRSDPWTLQAGDHWLTGRLLCPPSYLPR
jgi:hypothetical protein